MLRTALITIACLLVTCAKAQNSLTAPASIAKPAAAKVEPVTDTYFGTAITDPYRWMETTPPTPEFLTYLHTQGDYTAAVLARIPGRDALLARIRQLDGAVGKVTEWHGAGGKIFFLGNKAGEPTYLLMVQDADGTIRTLLDPAALATSDTHASISYFAPSPDGAYVVVGVALAGSENATLHIIDTASGHLLPDAIDRTFGVVVSWHSPTSFFYTRLQRLSPHDPPSAYFQNQRVYLHTLGSDPEAEPLVYGPGAPSSPDAPINGFREVIETPGSPWLIARSTGGASEPSTLLLKSIADVTSNAPWKTIVPNTDHVSTRADVSFNVHGDTLYMIVDKDAPNGKLVAIDLRNPDSSHTETLIPNSGDILTAVLTARDGLYLVSKQGVNFRLRRAAWGPKLVWHDVALPYNASISAEVGSTSADGVLIGLDDWTHSYQAFNVDTAHLKLINTHIIAQDPADVSNIEVREVMAPSTDGVMVPLSIISRKGIALDGSHPVMLVGYGSYGISMDPFFSASPLALIEHGGVIAWAHVRGGGEFGEAWHAAGQKLTKQHTMDDFIACARYLIENNYTTPAHLAIRGTSGGGLAVSAAAMQHPELFAALIDDVGPTDMVRFHTTRSGQANVSEFGDIKVEPEFRALLNMSAYHHVTSNSPYPALLAITGANDPRVAPWLVAKFNARLQAATTSGRPVLLRVDFDAGHGFGSSRDQRLRQEADIQSFILWQTGDPAFQPAP